MKKLFLIALICNMGIFTCYAQEWVMTEHEADELKGTEEYTSYSYTVKDVGTFVTWKEQEQYGIMSENEIFNFERVKQDTGLNVIVGLYDKYDKLKDKIQMWLDCDSDKPKFLHTRDHGYMNNPVGQKKKVKKIISHLTSGEGYVRIVASLYGTNDFDLKIPCTLKIK